MHNINIICPICHSFSVRIILKKFTRLLLFIKWQYFRGSILMVSWLLWCRSRLKVQWDIGADSDGQITIGIWVCLSIRTPLFAGEACLICTVWSALLVRGTRQEMEWRLPKVFVRQMTSTEAGIIVKKLRPTTTTVCSHCLPHLLPSICPTWSRTSMQIGSMYPVLNP